MKKISKIIILSLILLFTIGIVLAENLRTVSNPWTGRLDYVNGYNFSSSNRTNYTNAMTFDSITVLDNTTLNGPLNMNANNITNVSFINSAGTAWQTNGNVGIGRLAGATTALYVNGTFIATNKTGTVAIQSNAAGEVGINGGANVLK